MFKKVSQIVAISNVAISWLQFSKPRNQGPKVHMPNKYMGYKKFKGFFKSHCLVWSQSNSCLVNIEDSCLSCDRYPMMFPLSEHSCDFSISNIGDLEKDEEAETKKQNDQSKRRNQN